MQSPQPSKQFRWVGTLSEEELLGIPPSVRRSEVDAIPLRGQEPPPRRPPRPVTAPKRRLHRRDVFAALTVGAAVWLAVGGAGRGLQFSGAAPEAIDSTALGVVVERDPIASLPRSLPANDVQTQTGGRGDTQGSDTRGGKDDDASPSQGDDDGQPGGNPSDPPR